MAPARRSRSGEPLAAAELAAWRGLLRTSVRLRRELGARLAEQAQLTMAEYDALVPLADREDGRMRMAELADEILQPRSSLTRIVDALERRGLVRREPTREDRRGAEAVLTDAGRAAFRAAQRIHHDNVRALFLARLTDAQLAQLARAWEDVGAAFDEEG